MADKLQVECMQLIFRESVEVDKLVKSHIQPVGYGWFNQAHNFTNVLSELEKAFVHELEAEAEALREGAQQLADEEAPARVANLRVSLKILKRCCQDDVAGKRKILEAQELLVAAVTSPTLPSMPATPAAADDLVVLAELLHETSDYARALHMLHRAWALRRSLATPASPLSQTADALILHRQGRVLRRQGKNDEALKHYQKALEIRTRVLGGDHPDVGASYNNIGKVYRLQGRYEEALAQHHQSLDIMIRAQGRDHPDVATSHNNIGQVYLLQGQLDKALAEFSMSLEINIRVSSHDHPDVANSKHNMGVVLEKMNRKGEAKDMFMQAASTLLRVLGPDHPKTQQSQRLVAD
mmetsp:Transcript_67653/g.109732  ORF Transcript_67653/g.109732 Transcript_67653/m.109732 type:complete len:353 (+) Transcript_67653:735-1793(+)